MRIFSIRDDSMETQKDLAYLLYYEREKRFYIELPEDADLWETPLLLSSFVKRGESTVNSYWSKIWVQQRIVPTDRQNLGQILKDNHLSEYDEFDLLMLGNGRCAQDDYYLVELSYEQLPDTITQRFSKRIEDILPLDNFNLLVFFRDGQVKKCNLTEYMQNTPQFKALTLRRELFYAINLQTGGHGVSWDININIPDAMLYQMGETVPLSLSDFHRFVSYRVINVSEAAEILDCSRQNIDDLTKRGKLHPIKSSAKNTLYSKSEVLKRNWQ